MKADLNNEGYRAGLESLLSQGQSESIYFPTLIEKIAKLPKLLNAVDFLLDKGQDQYRFSIFNQNSIKFFEQFEDVRKISDELNPSSDLGDISLIYTRESMEEEYVYNMTMHYATNYLTILKGTMKFALTQQIDPSSFYYKLERLYSILFPKAKIKRESKVIPKEMRSRLEFSPFLDINYSYEFMQGLRLLKHFYDYGCTATLYKADGVGFVEGDPIEYLLDCLPKKYCRDEFRRALQVPANEKIVREYRIL